MLINIRQGHNANTTITADSIIRISDVFDQEFLESIVTPQQPKYIVSDSLNNFDIPGQRIYCVPLFIQKEILHIPVSPNLTYNTEYSFNFMINKKQINRFLCIKLVELFNLRNFDYTWSGVDQNFDMLSILREIDQLGSKSPLNAEQKSAILAPIVTPAKFINLSSDSKYGQSHVAYRSNVETWVNGLEHMFSKSAVSLVTESLTFQKAAMFTEKTAYAVLGRTFPIWIGGYGQASEFRNMGFDTFDDIIDHSYEYCDTLIERCYYAVQRNIKILQDLEYASQIRSQNMHRLIKNQQLAQNGQITQWCLQQVETWPEDLKSLVKPIIYYSYSLY